MKDVDLGEPTSFFDHVNLGCTQTECEVSKDIVDNYRAMFESRMSAGRTEKLSASTYALKHPLLEFSLTILEASESTRLRIGESLPNHHENHIAGKGDNSPQHYSLVHKFIPMLQAMKIPAAKAAVDKEWENWRKFRRGT